MQIELQYICNEVQTEILGKATPVLKDKLLQCFINEEQTYKIDYYLLTAGEITNRITRNLSRYIHEKELNIIRIALREIIVNAIEHGNLAISFHEKTIAQNNATYFQFLAKRRLDERFKNRHVTIRYTINK